MFSFRLGVFLGMEMLGHMVILFLTFWEAAILFPNWLHHFAFPPAGRGGAVWGFQFLHILASIYISLIIAILAGVKWYLTVMLICISLMAN